MKIQKEKLLRFAVYTLFGLLTFTFFLFLTFPFKLIEKTLLRRVENESGCLITIKQSDYGPAKVSWRGIQARCPKQRLGIREEGNIDISLPSLDLKLQVLPLILKQQGEIDFQMGLEHGDIRGHLTIAKIEEMFSFSLRTEEALFNINQADMSGVFSIQGESKWVEQDVLKGSGKVNFIVEKAQFKRFGRWTLPSGALRFSKIEGQLIWQKGRVVIRRFSARGETADLESVGGNLLLRAPINKSLLTLSLRATLKGSLKEMAGLFILGYNGRGPLKITVRGSLQAPQLSMNGQNIPLGF